MQNNFDLSEHSFNKIFGRPSKCHEAPVEGRPNGESAAPFAFLSCQFSFLFFLFCQTICINFVAQNFAAPFAFLSPKFFVVVAFCQTICINFSAQTFHKLPFLSNFATLYQMSKCCAFNIVSSVKLLASISK